MLEKYNSQNIEQKWQGYWEEKKVYKFDENDTAKPIYNIDTPPPFPTGEFHTGSTLNWCYIDFAARYKRMKGFNVLFPQGWDCHGFPTEVKVEKKWGKLPRSQFREKCLEWTHDMVGTIKLQMKQMAFSIDWNHEYFTISKDYHKTVQLSLLKMFKDNYVYHAAHPVLYCINCDSAIAKAETEEIEKETNLNYVKFKKEGGTNLLIATTRPEFLHACVAIVVNPKDERYLKLVGKTIETPIFNKKVKVVADDAVDPSFGTGAVMLCTFGDKQDMLWVYKFKLPVIEAFDSRGILKNAGEFNGEHVSKAKDKVLEKLKQLELLEKQDKVKNIVKIHDRCKKPIELINSKQWFIKVKDSKEEILKAADKINWIPEHSKQLLIDWTSGLEWDWVISRQRIFGVPLPFYYCKDCGKVYTPTEDQLPIDPATKAFEKEKCSCGGSIIGETAICDGWVDSSITPLFISKWQKDNKTFARLYPTSLRPQGNDIIRTWAFYTIFRCNALTGSLPFKDILVNGMVCGSDGKKMSKSLGNYVEAKEVITKTSVDALRQWAALSGLTGKDIIFNWKDVNYSQSFITKLWNASKFIESAIADFDEKNHLDFKAVDQAMLSKLNKLILQVTNDMDRYDFFNSINAIHAFFWKDVCDNYLETVKYRIYNKEDASRPAAQYTLKKILQTTLKLLAPFAPYISEEIWQQMFSSTEIESIHSQNWPHPEASNDNAKAEEKMETFNAILSEVRKFKAANKMPLNAQVEKIKVTLANKKLLEGIEIDILETAKVKNIDLKEGEFEVRI